MNTTLDFDNPEVAAATNPSAYGYHHGPSPKNNVGWTPNIDPKEAITTELNESPPNRAERLSGVNGLVCDIAVNGTQMCGTCCASQMALRRHICQAHPEAGMSFQSQTS
ncbi:hypothetical protein ASPFODRAFT_209499 [Aspergillus luchuensis CBS 106.47]|uniref:Uncharacterized protein n=1 Tax=Aspergillus luchuensis (strain CBS 106.47) TaxID=1137211 RepID=A0A1M3TAL6_ASPLC|nr:hypothetical protein ASPFODRAFT_209499 [Aspergillus luchuensis CBS 106.47]